MLEVDAVCKRFATVQALHGVSLRVHEGEVVSLIGSNGAGKSTLLDVIAGRVLPDAGRVTFREQRIDGWPPHRVCRAGIGRTFQIVRPFATMTVLDNVLVASLHHQRTTGQARRSADQALQALGLWPQRHRQADQLTLPDRRRLELARALGSGPALLLLDEVMSGLRPAEVDDMVGQLRRLRAEHGVAMLLVEHVMHAVLALAQRVVVLHRGEVIACGDPADVLRRPRVVESYLGEATW